MSKADFLDPRWQKFRLQRLEIANWQCESCAAAENVLLHVHHVFYISGRKPWEYHPATTVVLCDECHQIQHDMLADFGTFGLWTWEHAAAGAIQSCFPHTGFDLQKLYEATRARVWWK